MWKVSMILIAFLTVHQPVNAQLVPPGKPGADAQWMSAAKDGFGTSTTPQSKVWFTLTEGVLSEVYYPTVDLPNVQCLQLIVVNTDGRVETELDDTSHTLVVRHNPGSLSFKQTNVAKNGAYSISKTYVTDPLRNTLLVRVQFKPLRNDSGHYKLYVYYDPSLNNSGRHDTAWSDNNVLLASDADKVSALAASPAFVETTNGYLGTSDGLTQLRVSQSIRTEFTRAADGNVVQAGRLRVPRSIGTAGLSFTLALGFGNDARAARASAERSLATGFPRIEKEYNAGWLSYSRSLPATEPKHREQLKLAAMVLRALEDKTYRGAFIASPSIPWGGGPNANESTISGYHAVWSRDLYHIASALLALGDRQAAFRALGYLFKVQQRGDGSFAQNSWVDGRPIGNGLQLDQVALPIVLAYQLDRTDEQTWSRHVKPAAEFIVNHGPITGQDRWEEKPGYSPATIAAEIAGLVCAAHIASINNDRASARRYLDNADRWTALVEQWTATRSGPLDKGNYYLRITPAGSPEQSTTIEINSGGGTFDQRAIVDAGFLELVRLGIKSADDPLIVKSLAVVDETIKRETPGGAGWYRYNHDAYGEREDGGPYDGRTGIGRLWTLLTGERGEYEISKGDLKTARSRLDTLASFANDGLMIPEQVWDRSVGSRVGAGTGSATPLAWSLAQFIRLSMNVEAGRNLETPRVVAGRYLERPGAR